MLPNVDHLFWLRHDEDRFEAERNRIISEYISSIPEPHRNAAYAFQLKIDEARMRLSQDEFLKWMQQEARELAENLSDQFLAVQHKAQDIKNALKSAE